MSAAEYASPIYPAPVVDRLSAMIVGAAEVDLGFNVNVTVGANGRLIGGPGGHPDASAGAQLTVVTTRMASGAHRKLVDRVICRTTPGEDIDVIATEAGLIVHPAREELRDRYRRAGLPLLAIEDVAGPGFRPPRVPETPRVIVEYRDGSEIDRI
jgi:citrate lyase subunit alpha/citrate CoA-transferase